MAGVEKTEYFVGAIQESPADASGIGKILRRLKSQPEGPAAKSVILSKRSAPKDLRTTITAAFKSVRRSFDSLRSLRMTNIFRIRRRMVRIDSASRGTARWQFHMGIPFVGDAVPPAPAGRGFRKSEIFGGPSRRPAPTGLDGHGADSPIRLRFRKVVPRNGHNRSLHFESKICKRIPRFRGNGGFKSKLVRPYTPSGN